MSANDEQIGGNHYQQGDDVNWQHWDFAWQHSYNIFEYCSTKYIARYKLKNGLVDVEKAKHYIDKLIEKIGNYRDHPGRQAIHVNDWGRIQRLDNTQIGIIMAIHIGEYGMARGTIEHLIDQLASEANGAYVDQGGESRGHT